MSNLVRRGPFFLPPKPYPLGSIGSSELPIDLTASTRNRLPHHPKAPVQNVTQVNPNVVRIKDLLDTRLFRSSAYEVAFNCSWPSLSPLGGSVRKNMMAKTAMAPRIGVPRRAQCQEPKASQWRLDRAEREGNSDGIV